MVDKITRADPETKVLCSEKAVTVDLYADQCMPCKMLAPTVEDLIKRAL